MASTETPSTGLVRAPLPPDVVAQVAVAAAVNAGRSPLVRGPLAPDVVAAVQVVALSADLPLGLKEVSYTEALDPSPLPEQLPATPVPVVLDNQRIYTIVREVAVAHSGDALHSAVSADAEFATVGHPAYGERHFGLGFGLVLFTQESGQLGSVLTLLQLRSHDALTAAFGPDAAALLETTNRPDPAGRLAPVGGQLLWTPAWMERFQRAGAIPECQAAQNEQAIERQFRPMLGVALDLGLDTDRSLALAYDAVVSRGSGGGLRWIVEACGPLRTGTQRRHALGMLGHASVEAFQASAGLPADGSFGPLTHARLVGELRRQGAAPLPTPSELAGRLLGAALGPARQRLDRLQASSVFGDTPCTVA